MSHESPPQKKDDGCRMCPMCGMPVRVEQSGGALWYPPHEPPSRKDRKLGTRLIGGVWCERSNTRADG